MIGGATARKSSASEPEPAPPGPAEAPPPAAAAFCSASPRRTCSSSMEKSLISATIWSGASIEPTQSTRMLIAPPAAASFSSLPETSMSGSVLTTSRWRS